MTLFTASEEQWATIFKNCFLRRLSAHEVDDALLNAQKATPISGERIVQSFLLASPRSKTACHPLVPEYIVHFLDKRLFSLANVLDALLSVSPYRAASVQTEATAPTISLPTQEATLAAVTTHITSGQLPKSRVHAAQPFKSMISWAQACNAYETMLQLESMAAHVPEPAMVATYEQLGTIILVFFDTAETKKILTRAIPRAAKPKISSVLSHFTSTLSQWSQTQIPHKLQLLMKIPPLYDAPNGRKIGFTPADIAAEVINIPRVVSRVGVYAYLNAALCGRPLVDDVHLLSYLQARYAGDAQSMTIDLVIATFDNLANALHSHESEHTIVCQRSFVANKLPSLISSLSISSMLQPAMTEQYIQIAMARMDTHPFPPMSSDTSGINDALKDARHDFLTVSLAQGLISEATAAASLGQVLSSKPPAPRHNKQNLFNQITSSVHKADDLVKELDRTNGNAVAISNAVTEALRHFAISKETSSLRALCLTLCKHLPLVDIILQHNRLSDLLLPLCTYLNEWSQDEDQSELQPAYDDFAAIILTTLAFIHRYDIKPAELSGFDRDGFMVKLLTNLARCRPVKDLSQTETQHLSQWIRGLFAVDDKGESIGISDETMAGCSPQAFYLLVPNLFEQITLACKTKSLTPTTLKGGLEFLLEPFLLPSLIGGLTCLAEYSASNVKDLDIALQIMHRLLKPASISGDANVMHKTILSMLYNKLRQSLQDIDRRLPNRKDVAQLIATLKPYADSGYTTSGTVADIKGWMESLGTLKQAMTDIIMQLTTWSTQSDLNPIPTKYTHSTLQTALSVCGAEDILNLIVDEVTSQTAIGFGSPAFEVATSIICAPSVDSLSTIPSSTGSASLSSRHELTLQQALKLKLDNVDYLMKLDFAKTETLVRLGRLVTLQSIIMDMPLLAPMPISIPTGDLMEGIDTAAMTNAADPSTANVTLDTADQAALDAAAADFTASMDAAGIDLTSGTGDLTMVDTSGMNLDLSDNLFSADGDVNFDLGLGTTVPDANGQQQQQPQSGSFTGGNDEDIFAGIDLGMVDDFDFE